jgi:hypothetical protein
LYRVQLTTVYLTEGNAFSVDRMLGELIDDCPSRATWALNVRRKSHGL